VSSSLGWYLDKWGHVVGNRRLRGVHENLVAAHANLQGEDPLKDEARISPFPPPHPRKSFVVIRTAHGKGAMDQDHLTKPTTQHIRRKSRRDASTYDVSQS
jgi:hypothetical protein